MTWHWFSTCIHLQVQGGHARKIYSDLLEPFKREVGENKGPSAP
jgi:hypothetical protein